MASTTLPQLSKQFDRASEEINQSCQIAIKNIATEVYAQVIENTPIWTGSYLLSHRVGINGKSSEPPTYTNQDIEFTGLSQDTVSAYKDQAWKRILSIETSEQIESVYISNDIGHAAHVEYIGWTMTPAYHVYGKAYLSTKLLMFGRSWGKAKIRFGHKSIQMRMNRLTNAISARGQYWWTKKGKQFSQNIQQRYDKLSTGKGFIRTNRYNIPDIAEQY